MRKKYHAATLKDIAMEAGVSESTVSRAIQGSTTISESTRTKICEIAERMNYRPNIIARSLRISRIRIIGIIIPDNSNPYFAALIKGIETTASVLDYTVVIINTDEKSEAEIKAIATLIELRVSGLLSVPVDIDNYKNMQIPYVFLTRVKKTDDMFSFSYVTNDNYKGAYLAASHLIERGNQKIYFINGPKNVPASAERLDGYKKALRDADIKYNEKLIVYGNLTMEDGYASFNALLEQERPPFGVFCFNDYAAIGVMRSIHEYGFKIPEEISLVGYDDIEISSYFIKPLTTVRQSRYTIGSKGAEVLINMIENVAKYIQRSEIILEPELIIRETT